MSKYLILIDESGSFNPDDRGRMTVGGVVFQDVTPDNLALRLQQACSEFNATLKKRKNNNSQVEVIRFPSHLHYSHLRRMQNRNETDSKIDQVDGMVFTDKVLDIFVQMEQLKAIIRSSGNVEPHVHEQYQYYVHLQTLLLGFAHSWSFSQNDVIELRVGIRRGETIIGLWGEKDPSRYNENIALALRKDFSRISGIKMKNIKVSFGSFRHPQGADLAIADFFVSGMRDGNTHIPNDQVKIFDVAEMPIFLSDDYTSYFSESKDQEQGQALLHVAALIASYGEQNQKRPVGLQFLGDSIKKMKGRQIDAVTVELRRKLEEARKNRGILPERLGQLERTVAVLEDADVDNLDTSTENVRLSEHLRWARIEFLAHGVSSRRMKEAVNRYEQFCMKHVDKLYDNGIEALLDRIKKRIISVQHLSFNRFHFENVERFMTPILPSYRQIKDVTAPILEREGLRLPYDALMAKLIGTIGQAYGFMACEKGIKSDSSLEFINKAEKLLLEDLQLLPRGSNDWTQGNNFLVTLYWIKGDLATALNFFFWNRREGIVPQIRWLGSFSPGKNLPDKFVLANHLRLLALALEKNKIDKGDIVANLLETIPGISSFSKDYPASMAFKWWAYVLHLLGRTGEACMLCAEKEGAKTGTSVLDLMLAVDKTLHALYCFNDGRNDLGNNLIHEARQLAMEAAPEDSSERKFLKKSPWFVALSAGNVAGLNLSARSRLK